MQRKILVGPAIALALLAGACGSGDGAPNETAAANEMNAMAADPYNPFAQTEMQMNEQIMAAVGTSVGDSWLRKMIEHHQGAVDMSRIVLQQNPSADVAQMARMTIEKQSKEIEELRKLVQQGSPNPQSSELFRPATMSMHEAMMAARGADVSETFLRKMLEHHKGAVAMSDVALANGVTGAVRSTIEKTRSDQQKEAEHIEAMLAGQAHAEPAAAPSAAAPAPRPAPRSGPAERPSAPASRPAAPPAEPAPAPKPEAPAEPASSTCTPEHRAAGHC